MSVPSSACVAGTELSYLGVGLEGNSDTVSINLEMGASNRMLKIC